MSSAGATRQINSCNTRRRPPDVCVCVRVCAVLGCVPYLTNAHIAPRTSGLGCPHFCAPSRQCRGMDGGRDCTQHSTGKWQPTPLPERRSRARCRLADCPTGNTNPTNLSKPSKHQRQPRELQLLPGTCCFEPIDSGRVPFARVACECSPLLARRQLALSSFFATPTFSKKTAFVSLPCWTGSNEDAAAGSHQPFQNHPR